MIITEFRSFDFLSLSYSSSISLHTGSHADYPIKVITQPIWIFVRRGMNIWEMKDEGFQRFERNARSRSERQRCVWFSLLCLTAWSNPTTFPSNREGCEHILVNSFSKNQIESSLPRILPAEKHKRKRSVGFCKGFRGVKAIHQRKWSSCQRNWWLYSRLTHYWSKKSQVIRSVGSDFEES